jgi:hypothetical protein
MIKTTNIIMIPTAEEFFRNKIKQLHPFKEVVTLSGDLITAEQGMRWANEYSILKSQYHVTEALKEASVKARAWTDGGGDWVSSNTKAKVDKESILNAYSLENIK